MPWILMAYIWRKINKGVYKFDSDPKNLYGFTNKELGGWK